MLSNALGNVIFCSCFATLAYYCKKWRHRRTKHYAIFFLYPVLYWYWYHSMFFLKNLYSRNSFPWIKKNKQKIRNPWFNQHGSVSAQIKNAASGSVPVHKYPGLEKTRVFLKKTSPVGFFGFFLGFFGFFWYICPEVFRVFSVSRILLGASRL